MSKLLEKFEFEQLDRRYILTDKEYAKYTASGSVERENLEDDFWHLVNAWCHEKEWEYLLTLRQEEEVFKKVIAEYDTNQGLIGKFNQDDVKKYGQEFLIEFKKKHPYIQLVHDVASHYRKSYDEAIGSLYDSQRMDIILLELSGILEKDICHKTSNSIDVYFRTGQIKRGQPKIPESMDIIIEENPPGTVIITHL